MRVEGRFQQEYMYVYIYIYIYLKTYAQIYRLCTAPHLLHNGVQAATLRITTLRIPRVGRKLQYENVKITIDVFWPVWKLSQ